MLPKEPEIEQIKEVKNERPVCEPCPVCLPKPKPWQICLKVLLLLVSGIFLALIILVASGLRISRKESLLDIWLASRKGITPTQTDELVPDQDPTANWETYVNSQYGFEFKYPESFGFEEHPSGRVSLWKGKLEDNFFVQIYPNNLNGQELEAYIQEALSLPDGRTLEDFCQEMNWEFNKEKGGWIYLHQNEGLGEGIFHHFISSKTGTVIGVESYYQKVAKSQELAKILSTFKLKD